MELVLAIIIFDFDIIKSCWCKSLDILTYKTGYSNEYQVLSWLLMEILDIIVESNKTELFTAMSVFGTVSFIGNVAFSLLQL